VVQAVVLDLDREALDGGIQRRSLRNRPRAHDLADLEAQVEVVRGGRVLLHDELAGTHTTDGELLVTLDRNLLRGHLGGGGAGGLLAQEANERLDSGSGTLRMDRKSVVVRVADPAEDAKLLRAGADGLPHAGVLTYVGDDRADRPPCALAARH
jgi:hypothetical protein